MSFHYRFEQGQWTSLEDPLKGYPAKQYGFDTQKSTENIIYCGIDLDMYARTSLQVAFPFKFYAQLRVASVDCFIWLPELPDVFALLKALQVSFEPPYLRTLIHQATSTLQAAIRSGELTMTIRDGKTI